MCLNGYLHYFERRADTVRHSEKQVLAYAGSITVRSYPCFNAQVSTLDIKNGISEYHKLKGHNPDIVIIDSMDLLTDARQLFQLPPCGDIYAAYCGMSDSRARFTICWMCMP